MVDYVPVEKAHPIREPSTANLVIDSLDAVGGNASTFVINKNASIMNGYFTRIAVSEVVLNWAVPNIAAALGNNVLRITSPANITVTIPDGMWTVAAALDYIVASLNSQYNTVGSVWTVDQVGGGVFIVLRVGGVITNTTWAFTIGLQQFGWAAAPGAVASLLISPTSNLQTTRYLDFVSYELTYCQSLKDNSTATATPARDALCRWYFAWDNPAPNDKYGFPILMGYQQFAARRLFNPPKQIRWEPNLPIGNLTFQVYNSLGQLQYAGNYGNIPGSAGYSWEMTLQISEV